MRANTCISGYLLYLTVFFLVIRRTDSTSTISYSYCLTRTVIEPYPPSQADHHHHREQAALRHLFPDSTTVRLGTSTCRLLTIIQPIIHTHKILIKYSVQGTGNYLYARGTLTSSLLPSRVNRLEDYYSVHQRPPSIRLHIQSTHLPNLKILSLTDWRGAKYDKQKYE